MTQHAGGRAEWNMNMNMNSHYPIILLSLTLSVLVTVTTSDGRAQEPTRGEGDVEAVPLEGSQVEVLADLSNTGFGVSPLGSLAGTSLGIAVPISDNLHLEAHFSASYSSYQQDTFERDSSWVVGPTLGVRINLARPEDIVRPFLRLRAGLGFGDFYEERFWSVSGRASVGASVRLHRFIALQPELGVGVAYADQRDAKSFSATIHYGLGLAFLL